MSTMEILTITKQAFTIAAIVLVIAAILFTTFYLAFYKKLMHGTKKISPRYLILITIGITYIVGLFCVTLKNRIPGLDGGVRMQLFSSYRLAWNSHREKPWRDIILNIIMFVPLGILLPVSFPKCRKFWVMLVAGFCSSLVIEICQLITKRGIFEADDLWGNTFGALMGYGILMLLWNVYLYFRKEKRILPVWKTVLVQLPLVCYVSFFIFVSVRYNLQEFGNLDIRYSTRQDMRHVKIELNTDLDNRWITADVYQTITGGKEDTLQYASKVMQNAGTDVDSSKTKIHKTQAVYQSLDGEWEVTVDFIGLSSHIEYKGNLMAKPKAGCDKETILSALQKLGFDLSEEAEFWEKDAGEYYFREDMETVDNQIYDGKLRCEYDEEGKIRVIDDDILLCHQVKNCVIISESEAFLDLQKGYFRIFGVDKMKVIQINAITLDYWLDSKGYLQPVYVFHVKVNDEYNTIVIPALR